MDQFCGEWCYVCVYVYRERDTMILMMVLIMMKKKDLVIVETMEIDFLAPSKGYGLSFALLPHSTHTLS